jgi:hypothetical protein
MRRQAGRPPAGPCRGSARPPAARPPRHWRRRSPRPAARRPRSAPTCAARRPPVSSSRRPPKRWARWMRGAGQQRRAEPSPAAAGHHRRPVRSDAGGEPGRPVPARPVRGGLHAGTGVRPDLAHLPGRRVHRRHRRPASCGVQGRAARTDPLPGLPARRNRGHGQRAGAGAGRRDQDAAGDPAQLRGRCRPAGPASHPRSPTPPRPSSPRPT